MNRGTEYLIAKDRVKIGMLTERGIDFKGVIHVGTNDGYEIQWYRQMELQVLGFEPLKSAYDKCFTQYGADMLNVCLVNAGIGPITGEKILHETVSNRNMDDSGGSSFLVELVPSEHTTISYVPCKMYTVKDFLDEYYWILIEHYDCLVVDVQGMELEVLKSFENYLGGFKGLNIECSKVPMYEGEASAQEVIDYLAGHGFRPVNPIEDHNDILFERI